MTTNTADPVSARKPENPPDATVPEVTVQEASRKKWLLPAVAAGILLLAAAGFWFTLSSGDGSTGPQSGEEETAEAEALQPVSQLIEEQKYSDALDLMRPMYKGHPDNLDYQYWGAWLNYKLNRRRDAMKLALAAEKLDPKRGDVQALLGACHMMYADYEKALEVSRKALELDPGQVLAYLTIGEIFLRRNESKRSLPVLKQAGRLDPENPDIWVLLSSAYLKLNDLDNTLVAGKAALDYNPDHPGAHFNLAMVYLKKGDAVKAVHHIQKAEDLYRLAGDQHWSAQARKNKEFILRHFKMRPEDVIR